MIIIVYLNKLHNHQQLCNGDTIWTSWRPKPPANRQFVEQFFKCEWNLPNRRQAIIWANDSIVYWRIYASLSIDELQWISHGIMCQQRSIFCNQDGRIRLYSLIVRFMGPTWGPSGTGRTQVGPMLVPWNLLSGLAQPVWCINWSHELCHLGCHSQVGA